jgi:hypothetical protein
LPQELHERQHQLHYRTLYVIGIRVPPWWARALREVFNLCAKRVGLSDLNGRDSNTRLFADRFLSRLGRRLPTRPRDLTRRLSR